MMALVLSVIAASILAGSMHLVFGSQSTRTALAPAIQMASAVAKKVLAWVMTSSPGPMPSAIRDSQMASVPLPTPMACLLPKYSRGLRLERLEHRALDVLAAHEHFAACWRRSRP